MKGKSLQRELKKNGMTLVDKIPEVADDTAAIRKGMATTGEQRKTNTMLAAICRKQRIEMEPDEPEPTEVAPEPKEAEPKKPESKKPESKKPELPNEEQKMEEQKMEAQSQEASAAGGAAAGACS